ncbi:Anterior gradient protein 2 [Stygiomarasmius scandens]|uniref:Terpene synthase n=1 Tax=Marasmiellus scandens TaxID=2682957 RepID=A0ABR1JID1_9AGAR
MPQPLARSFILPDLESMYAVLPDGGLNPHHDDACAESRQWFAQYNKTTFGSKMTAFLESCKFELITSFTYPYVDKEGLRATMDWHNILWFFDEVTDTESGKDARKSAAIVCHTLRDSEYDDGTSLCRMMKEFRVNHISRAGPECMRRFLDHCDVAFAAGAREAELREKGEVLSIKKYLALRRETSGARTCFDMGEYLMNIDLPQALYDDEQFSKGYQAALDLIFLSNDLYSYNMEQAKGHSGANIVTVVMKSNHVELQDAVDYVGTLCQELLAEFQDAKLAVEQRAEKEKDEALANSLRDALHCLEAYGHWVRGNVEWSFETERYFGKENKVVKQSLVVKLSNPNTTSKSLQE